MHYLPWLVGVTPIYCLRLALGCRPRLSQRTCFSGRGKGGRPLSTLAQALVAKENPTSPLLRVLRARSGDTQNLAPTPFSPGWGAEAQGGQGAWPGSRSKREAQQGLHLGSTFQNILSRERPPRNPTVLTQVSRAALGAEGGTPESTSWDHPSPPTSTMAELVHQRISFPDRHFVSL